jgi:hypothetical protein
MFPVHAFQIIAFGVIFFKAKLLENDKKKGLLPMSW